MTVFKTIFGGYASGDEDSDLFGGLTPNNETFAAIAGHAKR